MSVVVWLKRDLRSTDHAPLAAAAATGRPVLAVFVIEPEWLASPESDPQHLQFALHCVAELRGRLAPRGLPLIVHVGPLLKLFGKLRDDGRLAQLFSHEETGPGWSYDRDRAVAAWCREHGVDWVEMPQNGVVRRLKSRNGWAARWQRRMAAPAVAMPAGWHGAAVDPAETGALPTLRSLGVDACGRDVQAAGEAAATELLRSFLDGRGADYRRALSSPLKAANGCSRLSPHLAFGTLSMRQVHQATEARVAQLRTEVHGDAADAQRRSEARALRGFAGRLRWHCHFMQKLESEPRIEFENFARSADGLRESSFDRMRFDAWCAGATGYPMVDACMRSLKATGWLNFRMRAMLVSFASYHLWLHWRETGLFLARQFLDFEPGIHWSQMQMQSGTTGINTLRIYSPTKQARDHDTEGIFIRRWVPELARVPLPLLATPWQMDDTAQRAAGCVIGRDYPPPIVDDRAAVQLAKDRLYAMRRTPAARAEADVIQDKHGSRKSGLPPTSRLKGASKPKTLPKSQAAPLQHDLFDEPDSAFEAD